MTATRPKELVYFHYLPFDAQEGFHYMFFMYDGYSEAVLDLGGSKELNDDVILEKLKKLMKHKDFKRSPKKPFTLMSSCGQGMEDRMRSVLNPEKGKLVIDPGTVVKETHAFVSHMNQKIANEGLTL